MDNVETTKTFVVDLIYDDDDEVYTMEAYFGDDQQGGDKFLVDIISPFVAITASSCDNCSDEGSGVFDPSSSSTFK